MSCWCGKMKGEWQAQCQMCTFPGYGCQIFLIPVIRQREGKEGRGGGALRGFGLHGFTTDSNKLWAQSESVDDVTTQRDGIPQWHFKCNTRARQRSSSEPKDGKQQWPCGRIFLTGVIIFRGQTSIIAQHTNNKTVQAFFFLKHKSLNKGHLKFTVRFRNEPDTAS